ncbi:MAG: hypothetical protein M1275_00540 [Patescibacteria group bacterium]|nr:hypothetical protein [Patescibacteria group bacterium]
MSYEITVPFRVTVRGGMRCGRSPVAANALAALCKERNIPLKIRVGDDVFETLARNAGKCYCHAEMGEQTTVLHKLQQEYPRPDLDTPTRLWGVVQDRFDLVRAMCDTDGLVLFPPAEGQLPEFLYMLTELGRRKDSIYVALVDWTRKLLTAALPAESALVIRRFGGERIGGALDFLRESRAFLVRTGRKEEAAA